jgi:antitoxin component YwqK of YwqJK toxin-antitoxin module
MHKIILVLSLSLLFNTCVYASKPLFNFAYVESMEGGRFYARAEPGEAAGSKGTTKIYSVNSEGDILIDNYDWYNAGGVILDWSPIVGKVAVLRKRQGNGIEMSFYLGGKHLISYTYEELEKMGAKFLLTSAGKIMNIEYQGTEQIPWTNQYIFKIGIPGIGVKRFDFLTGKEFSKSVVAKTQPAPFDDKYRRHGQETYWDENGKIISLGIYQHGEKWDGSFLEHDGSVSFYEKGKWVRTNP